LTPPKHTIPYWGTDSATVHMMLPYHRLPAPVYAITHGLFGFDYSANPDANYEYNMAAADVNPIKITSAEQSDKLFADAKALYQANCQHCHGEKGDGQGPMVASGAFTGAANLKGLQIADGQMFYSIYYGKGMMGAHAPIVNKREIWTLVHYIRRFQDENYGKFDPATGKLMATAVAAGPAADSTATK
jgi:mono/diheme cytochrome c family protein